MHFQGKAWLVPFFLFALVVEGSIIKLEFNGPHTLSIYACSGPLYSAVTFCNETTPWWTCLCSNENALASLVGCIDAADEYIPTTTNILKKWCVEDGDIEVTNEQLDLALEYFDLSALYASEIPDFNTSIPIFVPFKLDDDFRIAWHRSYLNWFLNNYDYPVWYSLMLIWWFALVMLIAAVTNVTKILFPGMYQRLTGPISNNFRKYILLPAFIGKKKNQEVSWWGKLVYGLVPSRWESLVIIVFIALNFVVLLADLHYIPNDPNFPTRRRAFIRFIATRSGIAGTMLTPLLVFFAGRNNVLLWLTGWNYATNITFHKWTSRLAFAQVLIHSIAYSVIFVNGDYYSEEMAENYIIWGTVGTVAMGLLVFQAMLQLRRRWYETFVLIHVILAVFYIIGCWYHLIILSYIQLIIPAIAVWGFDHAARLTRMVIFGFPLAKVTLFGDSNGVDRFTNESATLKVVIPKPDHWRMSPGGHVWVYFLKPTCFWQSHPFTCIESLDGKSVILYCKVKKGVTYNLYKYIMKSPTKEAQIRVSVEGPYCEPCQYKRTECVSYIAGGNGIPGLYSEAMYLATKRGPSNGSIKLHWIVRDYGSIMWFYEQLDALKNVPVETTIYLTRPSQEFIQYDKDGDMEKSGDGSVIDVEHLRTSLPFITFVEGRPSVDDIIAKDTIEARKAIAFVTCGHALMVDDIRYAIVQSLSDHEGKRIDFYEALQVWT